MDDTTLYAASALFRSLPQHDRCILLQSMQLRKYPVGGCLMSQTECIDAIGLLVSGRADVFMRWGGNGATPVGHVYPGDFFGDLACLTDRRAIVSIVCRDSVSAYVMPYHDFVGKLEVHDHLKNYFIQSAFKKLWKIFQVVRDEMACQIPYALPDVDLPAAIEKAVKYINGHYKRPISLSEVAYEAGMSASSLSRLFKQSMGHSFKVYLNQCRIAQAKYLMARKNMNVTEACFAVGYNDAAYFTRIFRKLEGCNPSQFKKSLAGTVSQLWEAI
ncbi:MAG: helix-turn-helix domain-containing protein [Desulfatitalea sp.]|nr:helix-turn-helix domain-containing protein [Desulfatitalea sp.]NNK00210.1 helix-turn-helix domain-containing protein [Desulfatitalea sp.]